MEATRTTNCNSPAHNQTLPLGNCRLSPPILIPKSDAAKSHCRVATTIRMASLANMPGELVLCITRYLDNSYDLAALALACRGTYAAADVELYEYARRTHGYLLCWASEFGRLGTVQKLLAAGASANERWSDY